MKLKNKKIFTFTSSIILGTAAIATVAQSCTTATIRANETTLIMQSFQSLVNNPNLNPSGALLPNLISIERVRTAMLNAAPDAANFPDDQSNLEIGEIIFLTGGEFFLIPNGQSFVLVITGTIQITITPTTNFSGIVLQNSNIVISNVMFTGQEISNGGVWDNQFSIV